MKKSILFLSAAGLLAFSACKKDKNDPPPVTGPTAKAMFMNTVLNSDTLRVKINDTIQSSVAGMTYLKNSTYQSVRAGSNVKTTFYFTSTGSTVAETTQAMTANSNYSYFAGGIVTAPFIVSSQDDLTTPASGKAKVRFVNLSPDEMLVDCHVGTGSTSKIESGIAYKTISNFKEVDAGSNLPIQMNDKDIITLKAEIPNQNLIAGKIYTFVLTGTENGSGSAVLKLTAVQNN